MKETLFCKTEDEIVKLLSLDAPFQARIIKSHLVKGNSDFSKMTNLPKKIRERLGTSALTSSVLEVSKSESSVKLLIELHDGLRIEAVRLSDGKGRYTACLSSQVGCQMGCAFCKTGTMGFIRNLTGGEIVEEFVHLISLGEEIGHIVFMGMGEALVNLKNVMDALQELHNPSSFNISYRKITISTSGYVPGIRRLTELSLPVKLAVSLVSANDKTRSDIMKINRRYPLSELKTSLIEFQKRGGKRITLEYCLLSGVNTSQESAREVARFARGLEVLINLIPWNPVEGMPFSSPTEREALAFTRYLKEMGINVTIRLSKGRDINGACGQLATEN